MNGFDLAGKPSESFVLIEFSTQLTSQSLCKPFRSERL